VPVYVLTPLEITRAGRSASVDNEQALRLGVFTPLEITQVGRLAVVDNEQVSRLGVRWRCKWLAVATTYECPLSHSVSAVDRLLSLGPVLSPIRYFFLKLHGTMKTLIKCTYTHPL
jgi:hypothetical protein